MKNIRRGMGVGSGKKGYYNLVHQDRWVHAMSAKGFKQKDYMKNVIRFEDLNPDYPSSQMQGIVLEIKKPKNSQHGSYINEKIENTKRFYNGLLDNFGNRIKYEDIQKKFKQRLKEGNLNAKGVKTLCNIQPIRTKKLDARGNMNLLRLDPEYTVTTYSESTRNGFRHVAILFRNGYEVNKATANYLNRTWESYDFQTVLHKLLDKSFDKDKAKSLKEKIDTSRGRSLMAKYTHKISRGEVEANVKAIPLGTAILYKTKSVSKDALLGEIKNLAGKFDMNEYARAYYNEFNSSFVLYGNRGLKSQIAYFLSNVKAKTLEQKKAKEELMKIYKDTTLDAKGRYMPKPPFKLLGVGFGRTRVKQGGKQEYGYIQVGGTKFYTDVPSLHLKQKEETKSTGLRLGVFGELGAGVKQ